MTISTRPELAECLGISLKELDYLCRYPQPMKLYKKFTLRKSNGSTRTIMAPNRQLRLIQRRLNAILYEIYRPKKITHGYIRSENVVTNAAVHAGNRHVLNLDIANFFPSIHFGRVRGMFESKPFGFSADLSLALAQLVCYEGALPQGAPTSPIISNFICRSLDNDLIKLCGKYRIVCTRYCDDITISTRAPHLPEGVVSCRQPLKLGDELLAVFKRNSFKLNREKLRLQSYGARKSVTGVVVNVKPNIAKEKYRALRAVLHYTVQNGLEAGARRNGFLKDGLPDTERFARHLKGKIGYYGMVMGKYSTKYRHLAERGNALFGDCFPIPDRFEILVRKNLFVIETDEAQGTAFLLKGWGLVTCLHNVWDIARPVDERELNAILSGGTRVYRPADRRRRDTVSLKGYAFTEDLLLLELGQEADDDGLELADNISVSMQQTELFSAAGYPNYAPGRSVDWLYDVRVRSSKTLCGQTLYVTDKTFIYGASGGPVFDMHRRVVGYVDRGNENADGGETESAFCLLTPLSGGLGRSAPRRPELAAGSDPNGNEEP